MANEQKELQTLRRAPSAWESCDILVVEGNLLQIGRLSQLRDSDIGAEFDVVADMTKIRLAGFTETVDSAKAIIDAIRRQQANRVIPV